MSKGQNGEPWVAAAWLRDHLLLPNERKDPFLWKKVQPFPLSKFSFNKNFTYSMNYGIHVGHHWLLQFHEVNMIYIFILCVKWYLFHASPQTLFSYFSCLRIVNFGFSMLGSYLIQHKCIQDCFSPQEHMLLFLFPAQYLFCMLSCFPIFVCIVAFCMWSCFPITHCCRLKNWFRKILV